jgi:hypothetical protein
MAKARGDSTDGANEREVRQQKLPLAWRSEATPASALPPPDDPDPALSEAALPPPEDVPAAAAVAAAEEASAPGAARPGAAAATDDEPVPASAGPDAPPATDGEPASATAGAGAAPAADASVSAGETLASGPAERVLRVSPRRLAPAPAGEPPTPVPTGAASAGVGDLLLSARADSGFSIDEASSRTRIPRDVIEHLECNACGLLPPEYYCSAHIEKLSALYNVDPKPILDRLHADLQAHRGDADGLAHFRAVTTDSESGAKISYVLPGPGSAQPKRGVSLTGAIVSGVIVLFLLIAVAALAAQRFRHHADGSGGERVPAQVGHEPPVELKEFIVTEELNAYELPIPAK